MRDAETASWEGMVRHGTFWLADPDVQCRAWLSLNMYMQVLQQSAMQGGSCLHRVERWHRGLFKAMKACDIPSRTAT